LAPLSGVSLPVVARAGGASFAEAMLITHRGLSGPAILQISSYWREGESATFDLLPQHPGADWLLGKRGSKCTTQDLLEREWPARFAATWCARYAPPKPLPLPVGARASGHAAVRSDARRCHLDPA
jgi:predicted flavoprotein YhiN